MSLRPLATIVTSLVVLVVLVLATIAVAGLRVDAQRWQEPIGAALTRTLGREVRLDGPATLTLSFRPRFVVHNIRIANPPGFVTPDFARIGELQLEADLLPLLQSRLFVRELRGREVAVQLSRASDGRGNWEFDLPERSSRFHADYQRVVLERVKLEYAGPAATRRIDVEELSADARTGQPLRLVLRGTLDGGPAYTVEVTTAPLSDLVSDRPHPFEISAKFPATAFSATGTMAAGGGSPVLQLSFSGSTTDSQEAARALDVALPSGDAAMAGELALFPGRAELKSLTGRLGNSTIAGTMTLDTSGPRPRLAGQIEIAELDVQSFSGRAQDASGSEPPTLAHAYRGFAAANFDPGWMARFDADVRLRIGHLADTAGDPRDIDASVRIAAGKLDASLAAVIAGARFDGNILIDSTAAPPRLRVNVAARDAPLDGLALLVFDVPYVTGHAGRFDATLDTRGSSLGELVHNLDGRVRFGGARFSYGNYPGGRPVAMRVDAAEVRQPREQGISGTLRGSLRDKAFDGAFRAGTVERILRERRTPFRFDGKGTGVHAVLSGELAEPDARTGPEIAFEVTAPRARDLAPWLGVSSQSDARVALKGTVQMTQQRTSLIRSTALFGRTSIAGDVAWQDAGGKVIVHADVTAELLAPAELRSLATPTGPAQRATIIDIPILPESLDFADSDVKLFVKRVDGLPLAIADLAFEGRIRGGELKRSPLSLKLQNNALAGTLSIDARGSSPSANVAIAGKDFDLGAVLRQLRVAQDIDASIGTFSIDADIRERRLGDALEQSSFTARIGAGTLAFRDTNTRAALRIAVGEGEIRADAGAPIRASIKGTAGNTPVALDISGSSLRDLAEPSTRLPFSITAEMPGARLVVTGSTAPRRDPAVVLSLGLTGQRLDALDSLLETALPPWGPYALTGRLRLTKRGYEVDTLRLALGTSMFEGTGSLDTSLVRPRLVASLAAERIQLDDFPLGTWSAFERGDGPAGPLTLEKTRKAVAESAGRVHAMFSRELLGKGDADVEVAVKRIVSGKDELGRARFAATVAGGRAMIGPIELEGRAGSARGSLAFEPRERDVIVGIRAKTDRLDYGAVLRRFNPGADVTGSLSLDLSLDATTPRLSDVLATGSGHADITVWPEHLEWGLFDLWSGNLLRSLLPMFEPSQSKVNCIIGHFDLTRGELRSTRLLIDTTNTRIAGQGEADFSTDRIHLRFVPSHKRPRLFTFATPVEVRGTFADYRMTLRPLDMVGVLRQWLTSLVTVPMSWFSGTRIPADGRDVCVNAVR